VRSLRRNEAAPRSFVHSFARYHYAHTPLPILFHPPTETTARGSSSLTREETKNIRLSKRMGELDMFSRREADRMIQDGRVLVDGVVQVTGQKVPSNLAADRIEIIDENNFDDPSSARNTSNKSQSKNQDNANEFTAVVLNKPKGFVSGQPEHGHSPAIRLLTKRNRIWGPEDGVDKIGGGHNNDDDEFYDWKGFAPAGRLDRDSTGLMVFTKNGVLAKKIIGASSSVEKEYIVDVAPAVCPTKRELAIDPNFILPSFSSRQKSYDLAPILQGGRFLLGDNRPLEACTMAQWIVEGEKLQIVLTEGRKHQIRRMCRELLGFHVVGLKRVRIGSVKLPIAGQGHGVENDESKNFPLPEGCWRPLRQKELRFFLPNAV